MPRSTKSASTPQALVPEDDHSGPKPEFAVEDYNKVARSAKLTAITLVRSHFDMELDYFTNVQSQNAPKPRYGGNFGKQAFYPKSGRATCEWTWTISIRHEKKRLLSIEVVYLLIYGGLEGCVEEAVYRFMRRVGRFATYPYFRAHVSQLSWESNAKLPIMPTIAT